MSKSRIITQLKKGEQEETLAQILARRQLGITKPVLLIECWCGACSSPTDIRLFLEAGLTLYFLTTHWPCDNCRRISAKPRRTVEYFA